MGTRFTYEDVKAYIETMGYTLISKEYVNAQQKLTVICSNGHKYSTPYKHLRGGHKCRSCAMTETMKSKRKDLGEIKLEFEKQGFVLLSADYKNAHTKLNYICSCKNETTTTYNEFQSRVKKSKDGKVGCSECKGERISVSQKGVEKPSLRGEKNPNYNPDRTHEQRTQERKTHENTHWRTSVFEKDNYTCQKCNTTGGNLNAHHLNSWHWFEEGRYDTDNGVTLCVGCHTAFHKEYGYKNNTEEQFNQFTQGVTA